MINTKKYAALALVDHCIGPELRDNPTREQIKKELEKRKARIYRAESENSQLKSLIQQNLLDESTISDYKELILCNEDTIILNTLIVERLEGALNGKPLYTEGYLRFKEDASRIFKLWALRKKYGLSGF